LWGYILLSKINLISDQLDKRTFGQRAADKLAIIGGSWKFVLSFLFFLITWTIINSINFFWRPFDPYPFILLNLIMSCLASIQAPIILMSQNRSAARDRWLVEKSYNLDIRSEIQLRELDEKLNKLIESITEENGYK
jgi:uncharacterized membrane protein